MAITDANLTFGLRTALPTGAPATTLIGTGSDLKTAQNWGVNTPVYFVASVGETAVAAAANSTLRVELVHADNAALTTNKEVLAAGADLDAAAGIAAGTDLFVIKLPSKANYRQYLGMQVVVGTAALSAGTINGYLTTDPGQWQAYADAVQSP